jgi:hypothetical protein
MVPFSKHRMRVSGDKRDARLHVETSLAVAQVSRAAGVRGFLWRLRRSER